jgi:Mrp family chromosome partitioning ATPase
LSGDNQSATVRHGQTHGWHRRNFSGRERHFGQTGAPRILALANQKGGVGKTTTAINLGTALAAIGERVLIVDLDPQGNASTGLGIDRRNRNCSTYDVLVGEAKLREAIIPTAVLACISRLRPWTCRALS